MQTYTYAWENMLIEASACVLKKGLQFTFMFITE